MRGFQKVELRPSFASNISLVDSLVLAKVVWFVRDKEPGSSLIFPLFVIAPLLVRLA